MVALMIEHDARDRIPMMICTTSYGNQSCFQKEGREEQVLSAPKSHRAFGSSNLAILQQGNYHVVPEQACHPLGIT